MKHYQWGSIMFGFIMVCYYFTGKQEVELIPVGYFFLLLGGFLSIYENYTKRQL
jgi:hypothetical protein